MEVTSSWVESDKHVKIKARGFELIVDHPKEQRGTDLGPTPSEVLLSALAGCFTGTLVPIARAMSIPLESVSLKVSGIKGEKEYESLRSIEIFVKILPEVLDKERMKRLVEQAKRNCTITNTLLHSPQMNVYF